MMSSLASFVVRRRRTVIMIWIALLVAAGVVGSSAFSALSSSFGAGPSTEAGRVAERLDDLESTGGEIAIITDDIDTSDPTIVARLQPGLDELRSMDGVVAVTDPWSTGVDALRSTDGRAALIVVTIAGGVSSHEMLEAADTAGVHLVHGRLLPTDLTVAGVADLLEAPQPLPTA